MFDRRKNMHQQGKQIFQSNTPIVFQIFCIFCMSGVKRDPQVLFVLCSICNHICNLNNGESVIPMTYTFEKPIWFLLVMIFDWMWYQGFSAGWLRSCFCCMHQELWDIAGEFCECWLWQQGTRSCWHSLSSQLWLALALAPCTMFPWTDSSGCESQAVQNHHIWQLRNFERDLLLISLKHENRLLPSAHQSLSRNLSFF